MENNGSKRREWVKTAAIIFLVIMLILTFFSNTIMNYSLPEVSAQYVKSGTLSEQIRGTATVEAAESYTVKINETRVVSEVDVKAGDKVEKGQTILKLEDSDSTELATAQSELESLEIEYKKMLLTTGKDYSLDELDIKNLEEDIAAEKEELKNISTYQQNYEDAKKATEAAQAEVDSLTKQKEKYDGQLTAVADTSDKAEYSSLDTVYYNQITSAKSNIKDKEKIKKDAEDNLSEVEKEAGGSTSSSAVAAKKAAVDKKKVEIETLQKQYSDKINKGEDASETHTAIVNAQIEYEQLQAEYVEIVNAYNQASSANSDLKYAQIKKNDATNNYDEAVDKLDKVVANITSEIKKKKSAVEDKLTKANKALEEAKQAEEDAKAKASVSVEDAEKKIKEDERTLETKKITLSQKQKSDIAEAGSSALDAEAKQTQIDEKKKEIEKLKEKTIGAEITAQVGGIIDSISVVAGETLEAGATVATIQMTEKGYTASISVTNDQAKKVKVGDAAEIQYFWYGDANAVLSAIKADSANPTQNKKLEFSVTGDVTPGQSLQLVMGGKGQQYDLLVPNSSIREDNNGKFVLTVVAKSSPLGNRYIAQRVDVQVVASDDTTSAVTGELLQSDFIISTSTKPIEAGQQVRLVESN